MNDDEEPEKFRMMPVGDMLTLFIALACLVGFVWLMFGPSPVKGLFDQPKQAAPPAEVSVSIPEPPKQ